MQRSFVTMVFCLCVGATSLARADEKTHRQAVLELCTIMDMDHMLQENMDQMLKLQVEQMPQMASAAPAMKEFLGKYMSWKALKDDFVKLYMETFNEAEVRQISTFYKTPVGQKTIHKMPEVMQRIAELSAQKVQDHMPDLMKVLQPSAAGKPH